MTITRRPTVVEIEEQQQEKFIKSIDGRLCEEEFMKNAYLVYNTLEYILLLTWT